MQKTYAWAGAAILLAMIGGTGLSILVNQPDDPFAECRGSVVAGGKIGGPFTLVNGDGQTVSDAALLSKPALVYFGYSYCADVCPMDNARNAEAADKLAAMGLEVTPIFISVDPKRDTPEVMKDYAANISDRMIGLTGSPEQVQAAAKAYKVIYNIPNPEEEFYTVDHTTFTYLMLPKTGFADVFDRDATTEELVNRTACFLKKSG